MNGEMSSFRRKVGWDPFNLPARTKEHISEIRQHFNIYEVLNLIKGLISLFAIVLSYEIRGNVVRKNWTVIAHVRPYLCHDSCPDKPLLCPTSPPPPFVCLFSLFLQEDLKGNWSESSRPPRLRTVWSAAKPRGFRES